VRPNASGNRPFHAGELARLAGVSTDTLRYYERQRLLPATPRSVSGYRMYPPHAVTRVHLIRSALSMGFSIRELAEILGERDRGVAPCHRVRELAGRKLAELESRIRELQRWQRELRAAIAEWDRLLARTPRGQPARLLEAFATAHPKTRTRKTDLRGLGRGNERREKHQ